MKIFRGRKFKSVPVLSKLYLKHTYFTICHRKEIFTLQNIIFKTNTFVYNSLNVYKYYRFAIRCNALGLTKM